MRELRASEFVCGVCVRQLCASVYMCVMCVRVRVCVESVRACVGCVSFLCFAFLVFLCERPVEEIHDENNV